MAHTAGWSKLLKTLLPIDFRLPGRQVQARPLLSPRQPPPFRLDDDDVLSRSLFPSRSRFAATCRLLSSLIHFSFARHWQAAFGCCRFSLLLPREMLTRLFCFRIAMERPIAHGMICLILDFFASILPLPRATSKNNASRLSPRCWRPQQGACRQIFVYKPAMAITAMGFILASPAPLIRYSSLFNFISYFPS